MFVGQYTFIMSRVCVHQPEIGGTYLTLLNSCSNMGAKWTKTLMLYVVEGLTVKVSKKFTNSNCSITSSFPNPSATKSYSDQGYIQTCFDSIQLLWAPKTTA